MHVSWSEVNAASSRPLTEGRGAPASILDRQGSCIESHGSENACSLLKLLTACVRVCMLVGTAKRALVAHVEGEPGQRGVKMPMLISNAFLPYDIAF